MLNHSNRLSRRGFFRTTRSAGFALATTGFPMVSAWAASEPRSSVASLYENWKSRIEELDWNSVDDSAVDAVTDEITGVEREIFAMPSASLGDVYRKIVVAHYHGSLSDADFDTRALVAEARAALGDDAPA